ncbi:MAG: hypothetical protein ABIP44_09365, partial [Pseudoxanthomonas sp.]
DKGRIVEEGDHRSLLARNGLYARLWAHQSGGFLGDQDEGDAEDPQVEPEPPEIAAQASAPDERARVATTALR